METLNKEEPRVLVLTLFTPLIITPLWGIVSLGHDISSVPPQKPFLPLLAPEESIQLSEPSVQLLQPSVRLI